MYNLEDKKKYYRPELMKYVKLNPKDKYFIIYIQNRLMNKLKRKWGRYELDNNLKNILYKDSYYQPSRISKTALYVAVRSCIIDTFDDHMSVIDTLNINSQNEVLKVVI